MQASKCGIKGRLIWRHMRNGIILGEGVIPNQVKDEGINEALEILWTSANQATWYMGLIDNSGFSGVAENDTYVQLQADTLTWNELEPDNYVTNVNTLRAPIVWGVAAGGLIDSSANPTIFEITSNGDGKVINGIFVTSQEDVTVNIGWLWSTVLLPAPRALAEDDQFIVGYEVSLGRV